MKICVVSTGVFAVGTTGAAGYSGLEHLAWLQAKGLAEKGHEVSLVAPMGSSCPGVTIVPIGPPGQWDERTSYNAYWQHLLQQDAIIDNSWGKWSYILKQEGVLKAPVLGVCHAPVNTMFQSLPPVDKPCFVCISEDQRAHFEALFGRPARTCYNGVDPDYYRPLNVLRTDRFLFLARFSTIKGPHLAIEACRAAGVGLDLVGDTSITNEPDYLNKCKSMADGKRIRFVGPATRAETVRWFSQAHCLLHPNQLFREPFGLAPVESMLCGTPVIAWDHGAMRETIYKCEHFPCLVSSLDDLTRAIKIAAGGGNITHLDRERARECGKQFTVQRMVDRYEELCKEALDTGGW